MPFRTSPDRIADIIAAATENIERTTGMSFEEFEAGDTLLIKGVLYNFLIIGEAANSMPAEIQARYPHIPWRLMANMRNVMAHEYFQVELDIIWNTIQNYLPPLIPQLETILQEESKGEG